MSGSFEQQRRWYADQARFTFWSLLRAYFWSFLDHYKMVRRMNAGKR